MQSRMSAAVLALVPVVASPAPVRAGDPPARASDPPVMTELAAHYRFNERPGRIIDESGNGHTLRVVSAQGGRVRPVAHGPGTALAFPGKCTTQVCPHVALQSGDSADLNPGTRDIAFGADVLLAPGQTSPGQNVVQKGYSATSSQYKLQIDGVAGNPSCVLVDVNRPAIRMVRSSVTIADNNWHRVRCERVGTRLEVFVDNTLRGRTTVPADLNVYNDLPLSIGAKGAYRDNDQFNGILDNVWVRISR
ncbi:LamG-like jellyroll fold domain-containing protein [Actinoplanes subglobosus]|uniref:LamG-like jellyroll fold domain-containing protein n=1 Tax=Actinoplanes subglobosus TaxID=1547892 RepID=A0ABV8IHQ7_9ACTN